MAYNKTTWADGDLITADKLNNIESGVSANDAKAGIVYSADDIQTDAASTAPEGTLAVDVKGDLYQSKAGKWALLGSVKGPQGDGGVAGKDGANGKDGAAGVGIKSVAFTTTDGKVTGVTVTGTDDKPITATVTETPAK